MVLEADVLCENEIVRDSRKISGKIIAMFQFCTNAVQFVMAPGGLVRFFPEHLGSAFLRAILLRAGIHSLPYRPRRNPSLNSFAEHLRETRPVFVGFTVYETNLAISRDMICVVRAVLPDAVVFVGGPNATFSPDETLGILGADGCLRGAGEGQIRQLVEAVLGTPGARDRLEESLSAVKNLVLRTPGGVVHTPTAGLSSFQDEHFGSLDEIPSPYRAGLVETPDIGCLTSRGCNQHCVYCSFAAISGRRVVFHSVERVLDDLEFLQALVQRVDRRLPNLFIFDDAFTLSPERAGRICEGMIARNIRLPMECTTRADRVDAGLLQLMRRAGFNGVAFGLESAVPRVLRAIGKVCPPDSTDDPEFRREKDYLQSVRSAVTEARQAGLRVSVSVMGGLPGESAADFRRTLDFVESLGLSHYSHNILTLFPGTPLYENRASFGLKASRDQFTGRWETTLGYDARSIPPRRNSSLHHGKWESAGRLADALCGRPHPEDADDESLWAVILHASEPSAALLQWLHDHLAVGGTIIVLGKPPQAEDFWRQRLNEFQIPAGTLVMLPIPAEDGKTGSSAAKTSIGHQVVFRSRWTPDEALAPLDFDGRGNCRLPVWIASAPGQVRKQRLSNVRIPPIGPGLQIADGCRWWGRSPRCTNPLVLHVSTDGSLQSCWNGPTIGWLPDSPEQIRITSRALLAMDRGGEKGAALPLRCPLSGPEENRRFQDMERLDAASQLTWQFPGLHFPIDPYPKQEE